MKISPPFVIRILCDRNDRLWYYREGDAVVTFPTMSDAIRRVNALRPFPKGQYPAVTPLVSVPESER